MYDLDLMPKEINRFNVTLFIDINDYVHVTVVDVERGRSQRQVIDGYRKMSIEEKKRLRRDARKHADDDDALKNRQTITLELPPANDVHYLLA